MHELKCAYTATTYELEQKIGIAVRSANRDWSHLALDKAFQLIVESGQNYERALKQARGLLEISAIQSEEEQKLAQEIVDFIEFVIEQRLMNSLKLNSK